MKNTLQIFTLLFLISITSSQVAWTDLIPCLSTNCTNEYTNCDQDKPCTTARQCFRTCGNQRINSTCYHDCAVPAYSSAAFWGIDVCFLECLSLVEREKGYDNEINICLGNCDPQIQACESDGECVQAGKCVAECSGNAACAGECIASRYQDEPLLNLIQCKASCLWQFLGQKEYFI